MNSGYDFDVIVIGGGPGGYAAALYGASAGLSVALVEKDLVGGTCLNRGCIPAKALLQTAEVLRTATHAGDFGITTSGSSSFTADWTRVADRTTGIVDTLVGGLTGMIKKRKIELISGRGRLTDSGTVSVDGKQLRGRSVILATGSVPKTIPGFELEGERIVSSDYSTRSPTLPGRVAVIGGGVVGAEFASAFTDVGVETTLLEAMPKRILPVGPDPEIADALRQALVRRGARVYTGATVSRTKSSDDAIALTIDSDKESKAIEVDQVLVAVGRRPLVDELGLDEAGVRISDHGFIEVDSATMSTTRPGVYAVGDVVDTPGLAHVAYAEAIVAIKTILNEAPLSVDYARVPWVVYTHPEVAWAGYTEAGAKAVGYDTEVRTHKFAGNGRAMIIGDTDGLVKVVTQRDGPVLGVQIVGPWASELITESYLAVNWQALPQEIGAFIHPHPSLSETVGETMLALTGRALHG